VGFFDYRFPYPSQRSPVLARNVVATSQPLAAQAGLRMLLAGGNAVDASLAAGIALTVLEPTANGAGSDAFAIVWDGKELHGLNASGRSPTGWTRARFAGAKAMPARGWDSVTVPGAVSAWVALSRRFGKLPFADLFAPAIAYARDGFPVSPVIAELWARIADKYRGQPGFDQAFLPGGRAPGAGEIFTNTPLAATLEEIARSDAKSFYEGRLAEEMTRFSAACGGALTMADLAEHRVDWCGTLSQEIAGLTVHEIPPNSQGIATLIALGILARLGVDRHPPDSPDAIHLQIEAMKLGLADAEAFVGEPAAMAVDPRALLREDYLAARAALVDPKKAGEFAAGAPRHGGTVYLAAADASGMMVSYIQSNYEGFGSGVVVPGTGISLQNRGAGFTLEHDHPNEVGGGKRPFHTIIPGFMTRDGAPLATFGVMGGPIQPPGHVQTVVRMHDYAMNPQAALDGPRFKVNAARSIDLEASASPQLREGLIALGHRLEAVPDTYMDFGAGQVILKGDVGYIAASDPRRDGQAAGF
jgi:gamma-glutamyltranspeptidase / glutathione hydrolase